MIVHTFSGDELEAESFLCAVPDGASAVVFRTSYFPTKIPIVRKVAWRKVSNGPLSAWSKPLDLLPVRPDSAVQTLVTELALPSLGARPGDTLAFRLLHVDLEDPLSHLLRLALP